MAKGLRQQGLALYVHIPFCRAKCAYCDFVSYAGMESLYDRYIQAVVREIERCWAASKVKGRTLYVGGGTPSVLALEQLEPMVGAIRQAFDLKGEAEITLEANPGTTAPEYLKGLRELGFNRLSLGVQSFADAFLGTLGRLHSATEAREAHYLAREAHFSNINLDLIYGLPGQGLGQWEEDLLQAMDLGPEHLSLYALTLAEDAPLAMRIARGELPPLDGDLAADMYVLAEQVLAGAGFKHYELSNWARDGGDEGQPAELRLHGRRGYAPPGYPHRRRAGPEPLPG